MSGREVGRDGVWLRIWRRVLGGPDAAFILDDLMEMYARDRARGLGRVHAGWRHARRSVASAASVWRGELWARRLPGVSWLDLKLGVRLLVKHPALTVVGVFALAIGIPVGLAPLQLVHAINGPLPFDEAERILGIEYWDVAAGDERRATLHDWEHWRATMTSFEPLAAARVRRDNMVGADGRAHGVRGAELTASAFAVVKAKPLLGRLLVEADEAPGATPVVVLGYGLWQSHFGGDEDMVGRTLQLGRERRAIVGVMPEGFLFPLRESYWIPLQARALDYALGEAPTVFVFGRLRDGVSRNQAQAEVTAVVERTVADRAEAQSRLRADVLPYAHAVTGLRADFSRTSPMIVITVFVLAVTCGNVGTLTLVQALRE